MTAPAILALRLLGPFSASVGGAPIGFPTRQCGFLLAVLALSDDACASRERLASLLWSTRAESQARASLRQTLYCLQRSLTEAGAAALATTKDVVTLPPGAWQSDVAALSATDPLAACRSVSAGLLDGRGRVDPAFEDWVGARERALRQAVVASCRARLADLAASEDDAAAEGAARAILELEHYDEPALRALLYSLARLGRRNEAQVEFERFSHRLERDLQVAPEEETARIAERLRVAEAPSVATDRAGAAQPEMRLAPPAQEPATLREQRAVSVVLAVPCYADPGDPEACARASVALREATEQLVDEAGACTIGTEAGGFVSVIGLDRSEQHTVDALSLALGVAKASGARVAVVTGTALVSQSVGPVDYDLAALAPLLGEAGALAHSTEPGCVRASGPAVQFGAGWFDFVGDCGDGSRIVGAARALTRWQAWSDRALSPLTERDEEIAVLLSALAGSMQGHGRIVDVIGEAGIGKTRLLHDFLSLAERRGASVLQLEATAGDRCRPFAPAIRMIRDHARAVGDSAIDDRLDAVLEGASPDADPGEMRRAFNDLLFDLVIGAAHARPLLLVAEDLHWMDEETAQFLEFLSEDAPGLPLLIVATLRPTATTAWTGRSYSSSIRLGPLSEPAARDLARRLIGQADTGDRLATEIAMRTGGNPLFIEETSRAVSRIQLSDGQARLPSTVGDLLAAGIAELPADARRLIATASAVGIEMREAELWKLLQVGDAAFDLALRPVLAAELMHPMRLGRSERRLRFRHALVHEAAHGFLLRSERRRLHARILDMLEREPNPDRLENAPRLAHHAWLAEDWPRALRWSREAGDCLAEVSAYRDARQAYEQALEAAERSGSAAPLEVLDLRLRLRPVLVPLGAFDATMQHLDAAETLLDDIGDSAVSAAVHISRSYLLSTHGRLREAAASACAAARAHDTGQLAHEAALALGQAHTLAGRWQEALNVLAEGEAFWARHPHDRFGHTGTRAVWYHGHLSHAHLVSGAMGRAREHADRARAIATETCRPLDRIFADHRAGALALAIGDLDAALALLEPAMERAQDCDAPIFQTWFACDLAPALLATGRADDAARLLEAQDRVAGRLSLLQFGAWVRLRLGELALYEGNADSAAAHAAAVSADLTRIGDRVLEVAALRLASRSRNDPCLLKEAQERARAWGLAQEIAACKNV